MVRGGDCCAHVRARVRMGSGTLVLTNTHIHTHRTRVHTNTNTNPNTQTHTRTQGHIHTHTHTLDGACHRLDKALLHFTGELGIRSLYQQYEHMHIYILHTHIPPRA